MTETLDERIERRLAAGEGQPPPVIDYSRYKRLGLRVRLLQAWDRLWFRGQEADPRFPGMIPILTTCGRCGKDLGKKTLAGHFLTTDLVKNRRLVQNRLSPEELQLQAKRQLVVMMPERCPRCNWPLWWDYPVQRTVIPS
jgi:hypothetical protein